MAIRSIPAAIKQQADASVAHFNALVIRDPRRRYRTRYRGRFLYLDRDGDGRIGPICRLAYTGDPTRWAFAIYRYSDDRYDPEEWLFPGAEHIDGTIDGARRAGLAAYP
jgi:hypothetical protein